MIYSQISPLSVLFEFIRLVAGHPIFFHSPLPSIIAFSRDKILLMCANDLFICFLGYQWYSKGSDNTFSNAKSQHSKHAP